MSRATPIATEPARRPRRSEQRAERRAAILAATVRILTSDGLAAVTHRAVAKEAEVPLAATTYYFASKEELIAEALALLIEDEIERLARRAEGMGDAIRSPADCAAAVADVLFPEPAAVGGLLAKLELYLEAARQPGLRRAAAHWQGAFTMLATRVLSLAGVAEPETRAPLLVAAGDGILMHALAEGVADDEHGVEYLRRLLEQLFALVLETD